MLVCHSVRIPLRQCDILRSLTDDRNDRNQKRSNMAQLQHSIRSSAIASQRDRATLKSCQLQHISTKKRSHSTRHAVGEWHWRSLKVVASAAIFDGLYSTSYQLTVVTTTPSYTVSDILPRLHCTWLHVTLISPSFSTRQLKLRATWVFWFTCKNVIDNIHIHRVRKKCATIFFVSITLPNADRFSNSFTDRISGYAIIKRPTTRSRFNASLPDLAKSLKRSRDPKHISFRERSIKHALVLSPVHTSNNVEATLSNATSRTILSTKSVECCFDKVERCFDIVDGVDGALLLSIN